VAFGHIADQGANLFCFGGDVVAEDLRGARVWRMEAEERVNQRGLAGPVWTKQTNRAATKIAAQALKYLPATESDAEAVKIDYRWVFDCLWSEQFFLNRRGECHTCSYIAAS